MTTLQRRSEVLSALEFQQVTEGPSEVEAFANLRKACRRDGRDFIAYAGLQQPEGFRRVTRAHVVAWRSHLLAQELSPATIRRKLAAPGFLYTYLSDRNAIECNPLAGVNRPSNATTDGNVPQPRSAPRRRAPYHLPAAPIALGSICAFRDAAGHAVDREGVLFGPVKSKRTGKLARPHYPEQV